MRSRLQFLLLYSLFWIGYFLLARGLFLLYHAHDTARLGIPTVLGAFVHGLRMDAATVAYIVAIPFLLVALSVYIPVRYLRPVLSLWTAVILVVSSVITTADLELFSAWGFRIDGSSLRYMDTPREMFASVASSPLLRLGVILVLLVAGAAWVFATRLLPRLDRFDGAGIGTLGLTLLLTALLVIPSRGGTQLAPINQSTVYFSRDGYANEAAITAAWNFFDSVFWKSGARKNLYRFFPEAEARAVVDSLFRESGGKAPRLLRVDRPNIILIVWESLTAKVVGRLGGAEGTTPQLDSLSHEGVFFDHFYASGNRTDKGLACILSGYPSQPTTSIVTTPSKTTRLPFLSRSLERAGYHTAFYYGGELEFANIKSYLVHGDYERLVGKFDFAPSDWNSKWGAHDHVVFRRVLQDASAAPRGAPFFYTVMTLSSHEPFEVPGDPNPPGTKTARKFLHAHRYTDQSLGDFVRAAKKEPWWPNTLIVVTADHGHPLHFLEGAGGIKGPRQYAIPMVWFGGALRARDTIVTAIGSQTDISPTLLAQLGLPAADFVWGKNILSPGANQFAYYACNDCFGWVDRSGKLIWDNVGRVLLLDEGVNTDARLRAGKALLQLANEDYVGR